MKLMLLTIFITQLLFATQARKRKPLYAFGLGGFYSVLPDYPAANDFQARSLVIPFIRYRGETFRSDDEGTRAIFGRDSKFKMELSFGGSFPTNSEGNKARDGMDDLDWTFEVGPRIVYEFYKNENGRVRVQLPLRVASVTDFSYWKIQGYRYGPEFQYEKIFTPNFEFNYWMSMNYLDEGLSDYFFEVPGKDARIGRREYDSPGGFLGYDHAISFMIRHKDLRIFLGAVYSDYRETMVKNSPLFKNAENTITFIGFSYIFSKSDQLEK